ncbi:MAG: GntR family transcriptional regulator [Planctomycetes bacterium]|nr:GntR family transcriptional regulator [Planctomycetota bacterium]
MFLPVDPSSGLPIYRQIVDQVRRMIASGSLHPGERVPSVRDLATTLQINPLTVGKAYGEMEREGVLESRRGLGMFVAVGRAGGRDGEARRESVRSSADRLVLEAVQAGLARREAFDLLEESWKRLMQGKGGKGS